MLVKRFIMEEDLKAAIEILKKGGIILYPTDTVWGIGCDATNAEAVKRIYELKKRADNKSMLVLVDGFAQLERYVDTIPDVAYSLIELSDKPVTIIYDKGVGLAENLMGMDGSIGVRVTNEPFSKELCRRFRRPVVSTSANISGEPSAIIFDDIKSEILDNVDYVVKYRQNDTSKKSPSSVIKLGAHGEVKILRS